MSNPWRQAIRSLEEWVKETGEVAGSMQINKWGELGHDVKLIANTEPPVSE